MSEHKTNTFANSDAYEPKAVRDPVPIWLIMVFGLLFYWCQLYLSDHAGGFDKQVYAPYDSYAEVTSANPKSESDTFLLVGKDVFAKTCAACHQPDGMGKEGVAPPLVGSEWVLAPGPNRIAHAVLYGLTGPITVKGKQYNNLTMLAWKDVYNDQQLAAVLSYIRSDLGGNKASMVKPEEVEKARKENHRGYETAPELEQLPLQ